MATDYSFEITFCESLISRQKDDLPLMEMLAGFYTKAGRIEEGLSLDESIVKLDPDNAVSHYNLACSQALLDKDTLAVASLRRALEKGYTDMDWLVTDPDLKSLHSNPIFQSLLKDFQIKH